MLEQKFPEAPVRIPKVAEVRAQALRLVKEAKQIFIVYSAEDLGLARDLRKRILRVRGKNHEKDVFLAAESLPVGKNVTPELVKSQLSTADLVVVACGTGTSLSGFVSEEVAQAIRQRNSGQTEILPVILKAGVKLPEGLDFSIQGIHRTLLFPSIKWTRAGLGAAMLLCLSAVVLFAAVSASNRKERDRTRGAILASAAQTLLANRVTDETSPLIAAEAATGWRMNRTADAWDALERVPLIRQTGSFMADDLDAFGTTFESSDGVTAVTFDPKGSVLIWDVQSDKRQALESESPFGVLACYLDRKTIATADKDGRIRVWNTEGKELTHLPPSGPIRSLVFSENGRWLAADAGGNIIVWEAGATNILRRVVHNKPIIQLAVENQGGLVAVEDDRQSVQIFSTTTGQETAHIAMGGPTAGIAFGEDGRFLTIAETNGSARMIAIPNGEELGRLPASDFPPGAVVLSPNGRYLAIASIQSSEYGDFDLRIVSIADGRSVTIPNEDNGFDGVAFSPDSHAINLETHSQSGGGSIALSTRYEFDVGLRDETHFSCGPVGSVVWDGLGLRCAAIRRDGGLRIFESSNGVPIADISQGGPFSRVALSPQGNLIAASDTNYTVHLWSVDDRREILSMTNSEAVIAIMFGSGGSRLIALAENGVLNLVKCEPNGATDSFKLEDSPSCAAFSRNGEWLVFEREGTAKVMQLSDHKCSPPFTWPAYEPDFNEPTALAVSQTGQTVAVGQPSGGTRLLKVPWNDRSQKDPLNAPEIARLDDRNTAALQFDLNGNLFASGSPNGVVRLVALPKGLETARIQHGTEVTSVGFASTGKLITSDSYGFVHYWSTDLDSLLQRLRNYRGQNLSLEKWTNSDYLKGLPWQSTSEGWPTGD